MKQIVFALGAVVGFAWQLHAAVPVRPAATEEQKVQLRELLRLLPKSEP